MFCNDVNVEAPKVVDVQVVSSSKSKSNAERIEKLEKSLQNVKETIKTNKETIAKARILIDNHNQTINKLNKKADELEHHNGKKKKILKIKDIIEKHKKIVADLEKTINDLNITNEKCKNIIENLNLVEGYLASRD